MLKLQIKFEAEEVKRMLREAPERISAALARGVELALGLFHSAVVTNIERAHGAKPPAIAFSVLVNAVATKHEVPLYGEVFVAPPADVYAAVVEFGSRPHWPPREPIIRWVKKKFGKNLGEAEVKSAAFLVSRAISRRGTSGHFMFQRAFEQNQEAAERLINAELEREILALRGEG